VEPALMLINPYPWSAPREEVRLKGRWRRRASVPPISRSSCGHEVVKPRSREVAEQACLLRCASVTDLYRREYLRREGHSAAWSLVIAAASVCPGGRTAPSADGPRLSLKGWVFAHVGKCCNLGRGSARSRPRDDLERKLTGAQRGHHEPPLAHRARQSGRGTSGRARPTDL